MKSSVYVDTNVILRFLLSDSPLHQPATKIFAAAEAGKFNIYLDEVILAEVIWVLLSFYKINKSDIVAQLVPLVSQRWLTNPRKQVLLSALKLYAANNLSYIDCWATSVSRSLHFPLKTFDRALQKLAS